MGGVKSFRSKGSKQWGRTSLTHNCWSNGDTADVTFSVGGSNPSPADFWRRRRRRRCKIHPTGVRTVNQRDTGRLHYHSATACSERMVSPLLGAHLPLTKNQCFAKNICFAKKHMFCIPVQDCLYLFACLCLTDCWPGSGTDWLTVNLSSRCIAKGNRI